MGTTPIKDVMFSFPIGSGTDMPGKTEATGDMFARAMSEAVGRTSQTSVNVEDSSGVKQADGNRMGVRKTETAQSRAIKGDGNESGTSDAVGNEPGVKGMEKVGKALEDKTEQVKDAIKEELGISDEELERAMANMGLTPLDLLDTDNLKGLMLELAGEKDPLALVTNGDLLDSINKVTDIVISALDDLNNEFGITAEELTDIMEAVKDGSIEGGSIEGGTAAQSAQAPVLTEETKDAEDHARDINIRARGEESANDPIIRETSSQSVNMQKKAADMMDDRKQDDGMQEAMPGQTFKTDAIPQEMEAAPVNETPSSYVDGQSILDQIRDQIRVNITEDSTYMELQLHPASLGTVSLSVASNGGVITANILVQNEAVKSVLESQLVQLLETFEQQGQKVEAIEVAVAGYDLDRSLNQGNDQGEAKGQDRRSEGIGAARRRRINLNELSEEDIEDLSEEEQLAAEMMSANGTSVDYQA